MPKSQKTNSASRASTKKQKDSKSTLFAKLRTKYHNLAPHQQASLKRIAILMVLLLIFIGTYVLGKPLDKVVQQIKEPMECKDYLDKNKEMKGLI